MEANVSTITDLFEEVVDKIRAGEPPPKITIAGQTYSIKKPLGDDALQQHMADIFSQLQEDKDAALMKLLTATIKGERVILVQQQSYGEGTVKYQYRFESGELPFSKPDSDEKAEPQDIVWTDELAGLTLMGLIEAHDTPMKSLCSGAGLMYTQSDCAAEIRRRLGIKRGE